MAKYSPEMVQRCADWVRENGLIEDGGAKFRDFCKAIGIDDMTYYAWMKRTEFSEAIKKAKSDFRDNLKVDLVKSLANCAKGYEYTKTKEEYDGNKRLLRKTEEKVKVAPNVGAAIFLLTNIDPERWKNRQESKTDITTNGKEIGRSAEYLANLPDEELFRIADELQEIEHRQAIKTRGRHAQA